MCVYEIDVRYVYMHIYVYTHINIHAHIILRTISSHISHATEKFSQCCSLVVTQLLLEQLHQKVVHYFTHLAFPFLQSSESYFYIEYQVISAILPENKHMVSCNFSVLKHLRDLFPFTKCCNFLWGNCLSFTNDDFQRRCVCGCLLLGSRGQVLLSLGHVKSSIGMWVRCGWIYISLKICNLERV